jgi:hypothetical protein
MMVRMLNTPAPVVLLNNRCGHHHVLVYEKCAIRDIPLLHDWLLINFIYELVAFISFFPCPPKQLYIFEKTTIKLQTLDGICDLSKAY